MAVCPGAVANFNVTATGSNLSYQWRKDGNSILNANGSSYTIASSSASDIGNYDVVVSNTCRTETSTAAALTLNSIPVISCPSNLTFSTAPGTCLATVNYTVGSTAIPAPIVTYSRPSGSDLTVGTYTVTASSTNACGTSTCSFTVTVIDNQNPTITAPANVTTAADAGICSASNVSLGTPVTADNCSVANVVSNAPAIFLLGTTTVTWTVTDSSGNSATATQTVTVTDDQNPTITAPANVTTVADNGSCSASNVSLGTPVTADNCSVASVVSNAPSIFPLGNTTVTWTVTDGSGNTATATQIVTVTDNQNPTITAPANVSTAADAGICSASNVILGTPVTADNCTTTTFSNNAPASFPLGTTTVTWTVTDGSGNIASAMQTVTVTDNQAPVITFSCSDANTLTYNPGDCGAIFNYTVSTSDNCSGTISLTRTLGLASGSSFPLGITTVTYTAVDANGNTSSKSFTVTVNPLIITPVITINPSAVQFSDSITFAATLAGGAPGTCNTSAGAAQTVSFYIGGYLMGTVPLTVSGSDLVGTLTTVLLENTPPADFTGGPLSPGAKNVTASFNSLNSNFTVLAGNSPQLSIQQEDARVTYIGVLFASTGNINSSTAIVTLSATIQDISAISNSGDGAPGDIRYAKVQFVNKNNNSTIGPVLSVVLVNVNDRKTGTVTYDWTTPAFTGDGTEFQIGIRVLNYYSRYSSDEDVVVQVSKPASDFVSGGGFLLLSNSAGEMAGTSGTKNNFGFNIKYNKSNRNLQGSINCIFRRVDAGGVVRVYQVKGNQMSSLRVNSSKNKTPDVIEELRESNPLL